MLARTAHCGKFEPILEVDRCVLTTNLTPAHIVCHEIAQMIYQDGVGDGGLESPLTFVPVR